jgi:shikimate dehydrogenase
MDRYVVAGNPVEHSQSPFIHAAFAKQTGQQLTYDRLLAPFDAFEPTIRGFAESGGKGCNVTVPFKFDAYHLARRTTERAALAQAANVLRFDADGWLGDNTDGIGLVRDIERNAGVSLAGKRVLLIGAGGAAAGVLAPLLAARTHEIVVANRTLERARQLVERHRGFAAGAALRASSLEDCGSGFDIVINASASSMQGSAVPVPTSVLKPGALAIDLMYGAAAKGFLDWATAAGAQARDGLGMLVEQAAQAFEFWRGIAPDTAPVLAALRERMAAQHA